MATPETREAIVFVHMEPTQEFGAFLCGWVQSLRHEWIRYL